MKEGPDHRDFAAYNNDKKKPKVQAFLQENAGNPRTSPPRQNRAVISDPNRFRETDVIGFHDTYERRRINLTLL